MNTAPIIFIHIGDSEYLHYTLTTAKLLNPDKEIILIGDNSNRKYADRGITFIHIDAVPLGKDRATFNKIFTPIIGNDHGKDKWVKFVFERWFIIADYAEDNSVDKFWTFDSDTLILTRLSTLEQMLSKYDCTEQCNGMCINGYVSNTSVARRYVQFINELYNRPEYLDEWREYVSQNPSHAFTEMGAYASFKKERGINAFHLMSDIDGTTFDDCICQQHNMEMYKFKNNGITIKQLYSDMNGYLYARHSITDKFIRLLSLNMSWAPDYMFKKIYRFVLRLSSNTPEINPTKLAAIDNLPTVFDRIQFRYKAIKQYFKK